MFTFAKQLKQKIMGRVKIKPELKKTMVSIGIESRVFDVMSRSHCKEIAEIAVNKEYEKQLKLQKL